MCVFGRGGVVCRGKQGSLVVSKNSPAIMRHFNYKISVFFMSGWRPSELTLPPFLEHLFTGSHYVQFSSVGRLVYPGRPPSRRGAWELITKPRPLAVIRNRRLNSVALLVPLRSVQFSLDLCTCVKLCSWAFGLDFTGYYFMTSIITL